MAKKTIAELKNYFKVAKRPTESQFGDLIDSYVHKDESSEYSASVEFPVGFQVGDYVEFLQFSPAGVGAGGFFEVSIVYTRGFIASAATHIASVSHANKDIWRECGTINKNNYLDWDSNYNFTIDVNGGLKRFRIRAVNTIGSADEPLKVFIKIRSVNKNDTWTTMEVRGNNPASIPLQPMTKEWNLWVGDLISNESAKVGLKVNKDGNVGIKTQNPVASLDIQGRVLFDTESPVIGGAAIRGYETMWARGYNFVSSNGTQNIGGFGAVGEQNRIYKYYIGKYEDQIVSFNPENRQTSFNGNIDVYGEIKSNSQRISDYSPTIYLDRSENFGGYTQGIQTRLSDGTNNWFFGNGGPDTFIVSSGTYNGGRQLVINKNGNAAFQGKVEAKEFLVSATPTADHVFASDYNLRGIHELEKFITEKSHLPEIPSAKEMTDNGLSLGDFQIKLLQKIEELTLYAISQNKEIESLKAIIKK
ncbi:hypothetical protein [Chryseobacterium sp.]|uniref:hypothetical protein n=1 Tax=Chryseobacterium sp. TaxID=1871047 RepID=UPI0032194178